MTYPGLSVGHAGAFLRLPLDGLVREYPNHLMHLMSGDADALPPRRLHPIFYGCYDWHSAVHGFWLLARILRRHPNMPKATAILGLFDRHLTAADGQVEAAYFDRPGGATYERPYGWSWLLALCAELRLCDRPQAPLWLAALQPLEEMLRARMTAYLAKLDYAIRVGTHYNTAFAMLLTLHHADVSGDADLSDAVTHAAQRLFAADTDYPARYEPSGDDFLSGALCEAMLMGRILERETFPRWFSAFLPGLNQTDGGMSEMELFSPVQPSDRKDAKSVHLDGLNLSRAWCLRGIAETHLDGGTKAQLLAMAQSHEAAGLPHVASGNYVGEHWLATFAVLARDGL